MTSRKKPGWAFWTTVALVVVPLLYVLSSGPMQMAGMRNIRPLWSPAIVMTSDWYRTIYWPLLSAHRQSWGKPLSWYWRLFPIIGEVGPRPR